MYLRGGYAPVGDEVYETGLHVAGQMPAALAGVFMRVGPNPLFRPLGDYHWFGEPAWVLPCDSGGSSTLLFCL